MKFAYADPPYFGCCKLYGHYHPDGLCWDDLDTHRALMLRLKNDYPDGWALSMGSPDLLRLLPSLSMLGLPDDVRVAAWVKPFASFKPNVNPAYTWEPVLFRGGRKGDRTRPTVQDHLAEPITLRRGLTGAKPDRFNRWVLDLLGWEVGDLVDDLYPGTGGMDVILDRACGELQLGGSA